MRRLWLSVLMFPLAAQAADISAFTATYEFNLDNKLSGKATRELTRNGDRYHYEFRANAAFASAVETSDFGYDGAQVKSLVYRNHRQLFFRSRDAGVNFDWTRRMGHAFRYQDSLDFPLQDGVLDPLNLEMQLRHDLLSGGKFKGEFMLADPKGMHPVRFEINGTERIRTPYGTLDTVKVRRIHEDPERDTQFWLAPSLDYLPVRFVQKDDGAVSTLTLSTYRVTAPPVPAAAVSPPATPAR